MSEENVEHATGESAPVFRVQKMYLKDLSFENPNAPAVYKEQNLTPNVDVKLEVRRNQLDEVNWEVSLSITAALKTTDGKTVFIIELEHAGLFFLKNIPVEYLDGVLAVECPTLLFPFTRQIMSQLAVDGGFMPFLMDPVNFAGLFQNSQAQKQGTGKESQ
ncbi:MAG: protein-export chaperone SecB [Desulfobulbaceae bacterium]|nr:protein-export chaperone SecB [Desulfobulbaceae bacterium]